MSAVLPQSSGLLCGGRGQPRNDDAKRCAGQRIGKDAYPGRCRKYGTINTGDGVWFCMKHADQSGAK
jgi:hypothetical protein